MSRSYPHRCRYATARFQAGVCTMKIMAAVILFTVIGSPVNAQQEYEVGGSAWVGRTKAADDERLGSIGRGGWVAISRDRNRTSLRVDYFGHGQECSSCGEDRDGLLLFLLVGRTVNLLGPISMHVEGGPGYLRLGDTGGFGPRVSGSLQVTISKVGLGAEMFYARSLGAEWIRPVGLGFTGRVRW